MAKKKKAIIIFLVIIAFTGALIISVPYLHFTFDNYKPLIQEKAGVVSTLKTIKSETAFRDYYSNRKKDINYINNINLICKGD